MSRQDPADSEPITGGSRRDPGTDEPADREDWADRAARARTADDPRRTAPHDSTGVPSTGDER